MASPIIVLYCCKLLFFSNIFCYGKNLLYVITRDGCLSVHRSVCLSSVEIPLVNDYTISNKPILFKFSLEIVFERSLVTKFVLKVAIFCNLRLFANTFLYAVLTDLNNTQTFILHFFLKIRIHVRYAMMYV